MTMTPSPKEAGRRAKFPGTDAELFEHIRERANIRPPISWETIAADLGVAVSDLLDWFLAYRSPKRDKATGARANRSSALIATNPGGGNHGLGDDARRFANWKRAHDGAASARAR